MSKNMQSNTPDDQLKAMEQSDQQLDIDAANVPELRPAANVPTTDTLAPTAAPDKDMHQDEIQPDPLQTELTTKSIEGARPVPAQTQLPSNSYVYANTSNIGGVISTVAEQYGLDPHELESLTSSIRGGKTDLSGFWKMQVGYYPGMSAEGLVENIGRVAELSGAYSEKKKQEAQAQGKSYDSHALQPLIDSLQTPDNKSPGKEVYYRTLDGLRQADHVQFDSENLSKYYELQIKSGVSKAQAWENTMNAQDKYRSSQDARTVMQDFDQMGDPIAMQNYTDDLFKKMSIEKNPEAKIRMYSQYEAATKMTAQYAAAFEKDSYTFLVSKDPSFKSIMKDAEKNKDYSQVIKHLDQRYDELGIPETDRKYLSQVQAKGLASQINAFMSEDPSKAQSTLMKIMTTYKQGSSKAINQLMKENKVGPEARVLIEAAKTGSPAYNGDVLNMMKNKMALKGNYLNTMFGVADNATAKTLSKKLESKIYGMPGYKAVVQNLDMAGNVKGKIELAQYYADMGAYYKYKNPSLSDAQAAQMVQTNLIDSVYSYDAGSRVILQKRTLDGKDILYSKYSPAQAVQYLTNRGFAGLGYTVSGKPHQTSDALLKNKNNIQYRVLDQRTVQPFYHDAQTGVSELILDKNNKPLRLNLSHLGLEDVVGTQSAREAMRKTLKEIYNVSGAIDPQTFMMTTGRLGGDPNYFNSQAYKSNNLIKNIDKTVAGSKLDKTMTKELERTNLSERQIQALNDATSIQQEFDNKLKDYQNLQKAHRDMVQGSAGRAYELVGPFVKDMMTNGNHNRVMKTVTKQDARAGAYKDELKKQREQIYKLEKEFLHNTAIFLDYKGNIPERPFTKEIDENLYEKMWYGGY